MKKTLILASLFAIIGAVPVIAAETAIPTKAVAPAQAQAFENKNPAKADFKAQKAKFEKRLKLTDEQKEQAKQIRIKGHEEIKPVMEKIKKLHEQAVTVKNSNSTEEVKQAKMKEIKTQMRDLQKQARELRIKNMKEFESILTDKQVKELQKMKKEGRKKFDREFKKHHPHPFAPAKVDKAE